MMTRWLKGLLILPWLGIVTLPLQGLSYEAMTRERWWHDCG